MHLALFLASAPTSPSMPMQMHGYISSPVTPLFAYAMSCLGSALGLSAMSRTRSTAGLARWRWLTLGAIALGGTGIWVMHFIAMLGYSVKNATITYDLPTTIISMLISVVVVGIGLAIATAGRASTPALLSGGVVTGLGVATMHYVGISAMRMPADIHYQPLIVLASIVIAVVAATVALWAAMNIRGTAATVGAALIMGVAVTGMHYTGIAAMSLYATAPGASGMTASQLLGPMIGGISLTTIVLLFVVGLSATERDLIEQAEIRADLQKLAERRR